MRYWDKYSHAFIYIWTLWASLKTPRSGIRHGQVKTILHGKKCRHLLLLKVHQFKKNPRFFYSLLWKIETYKKTQLKAKIVNRKRVEKPPNFFWWNKPKRIFLFNISIRCNTYCICAKLYFNMKCIFLNVNLLKFWAVYTHIQILYLKAFALLLIR